MEWKRGKAGGKAKRDGGQKPIQSETKCWPDKLTWWPSSAGPEASTCHVFIAISHFPTPTPSVSLSLSWALFLSFSGCENLSHHWGATQLQSAAMISINYGTNSQQIEFYFALKGLFICISLIRRVCRHRRRCRRVASNKLAKLQVANRWQYNSNGINYFPATRVTATVACSS